MVSTKIMNLAKYFPCAVLASLLIPMASSGTPDEPYSHTMTAAGLAILQTATQVQTYRVEGTRATLNSIPGRTLDGYTITRKGDLQGKAFTQRLAKAITVAFAYTGPQDLCRLSPVVAYQFQGRSETVDVFVCFRCGDIAIIEHDVSGKIVNETGTRLDAASHWRWVQTAQSSFPNDTRLKALR